MPLSAAFPVLVRVTDCAGEATPGRVPAKAIAAAERVAAGAGAAVPTPLSVSVCGKPSAVSAMTIVEERLAVVCGLNVRVRAHVAKGTSDDPQVLVIE